MHYKTSHFIIFSNIIFITLKTPNMSLVKLKLLSICYILQSICCIILFSLLLAELSSRTSSLTVCAVAQYSFCSTRLAQLDSASLPLAVWLSPDKKIKPYTLLKVNFHRVMAHFFAWLVANTQIYTPCPISS